MRKRITEAMTFFIAERLLPKQVRQWVIVQAHSRALERVPVQHQARITAGDLYEFA